MFLLSSLSSLCAILNFPRKVIMFFKMPMIGSIFFPAPSLKISPECSLLLLGIKRQKALLVWIPCYFKKKLLQTLFLKSTTTVFSILFKPFSVCHRYQLEIRLRTYYFWIYPNPYSKNLNPNSLNSFSVGDASYHDISSLWCYAPLLQSHCLQICWYHFFQTHFPLSLLHLVLIPLRFQNSSFFSSASWSIVWSTQIWSFQFWWGRWWSQWSPWPSWSSLSCPSPSWPISTHSTLDQHSGSFQQLTAWNKQITIQLHYLTDQLNMTISILQ